MSGAGARKPQQNGLSHRFRLGARSYDSCQPRVPGLKNSRNDRAMPPDEFGCIADLEAVICFPSWLLSSEPSGPR
jgi:hypothetical protein